MASKYRNVRTVVDGIKFASKREAKRYSELRLLEQARKISGLCCQTRYELSVGKYPICVYVADFTYIENDRLVVEDVKGVKTAVYRIKKKLMKACYGIEIREIK